MSKKDKKKKEKIVYIDDGRTIADMSGTSGGMFSSSRKKKEKTKPIVSSRQTPWQTYWNAVRMMIVPMLITIGIITVAFLLMRLLMM